MIACRVVAVPQRIERARALAARVGGLVVVDEGNEGTFATHRRALAWTEGASHVVVLEDDALVCDDFTDHVRRLVGQRPDHLLGLYVGKRFPRAPQAAISEAVESGSPWLDHPRLTAKLYWAVGYVMPTADVPAVLEHLAHREGQHPWLETDKRLGRWHAARGRLSYPYPSPVDHDDTLPSTTSTSRRGRVAWGHCRKGVAR